MDLTEDERRRFYPLLGLGTNTLEFFHETGEWAIPNVSIAEVPKDFLVPQQRPESQELLWQSSLHFSTSEFKNRRTTMTTQTLSPLPPPSKPLTATEKEKRWFARMRQESAGWEEVVAQGLRDTGYDDAAILDSDEDEWLLP